MSEGMPPLPPHPGWQNMEALELLYDGPIPDHEIQRAKAADRAAQDAWVRNAGTALIRFALNQAYSALKDNGPQAAITRAAAAGAVKAALSHPDLREV